MAHDCLDSTAGPWHSGENVDRVLPCPLFARKDSKGQREHDNNEIALWV